MHNDIDIKKIVIKMISKDISGRGYKKYKCRCGLVYINQKLTGKQMRQCFDI